MTHLLRRFNMHCYTLDAVRFDYFLVLITGSGVLNCQTKKVRLISCYNKQGGNLKKIMNKVILVENVNVSTVLEYNTCYCVKV